MSEKLDTNALNMMLKAVSSKLGTTPDALRNQLQSGKFDPSKTSLSSEEAKKVDGILGDNSKLEKIMNSPQAKELMKKFSE